MEGKKISFGFMKTKKAEKPISINNEDKRDYIECVEEQSIKVVGGEVAPTNEPLVIPMKPNTLMNADRFKEIALEVESALEEPIIKTESIDVNMTDPLAESETLDQMAVRELMQEAKKEVSDNPTISIPSITKNVQAEGEKESTLDDYEAVPIQEFGVAMLRGMGWTPGQSGSKYKQPELRPKGLGLGADKVVKAKQPQTSKDGKQEEMILMKNAFVKITCGKFTDFYGKVVSLDEDNGRVLVDIPLKKETVSLSEFMMHVVTKSEYDRESKVINADSYEEYKRKESLKKSSNQEKHSKRRQDNIEKEKRIETENRRDEKDKQKRDRADDNERNKRVDKEVGSRGDRNRVQKTESSDESEKESYERRERREEKERRELKEAERREERQKFKRDEREKEREMGKTDQRDKDKREQREKERRGQKEKNNRDGRENTAKSEKRTQNRGDSEEDSESDSGDSRRQRDQRSANDRHKNKRDSSSSEDKSVQKKRGSKRYSSTDSLSYLSDTDKKHKYSKSKTKNATPEAKRDIDKKRKGKKKKRDRDRSPNYKKYRK